MKLVLEARHLFDGSIAAVANKAAHSAHEHTHPDASHATTHVHHHHHHGLNAELHRESANAALYPGVPALAPNPHATEILFVDPRVSNWQTLAAGVKSDVQVVLIDPDRDGIAQVTAALKGRPDLTAIHFLTYGQAGQLELGNAPVTAATLASHAGQVASWGDHLAANGDIEFWGCDVGAGDSGAAFVNSVHALTGAQVGASTDATGAAQLGGDWTLERTTGVLAVGTPFTTAAMAAYTGVLDTPLPTVTFDPTTVPGDILLGSTFTETVNFSNAAGNAVGYGPFIDLFVPSDANQKVTLTSATFLGTAVSFQKITITNVAGEGLGAFSPLALGSDGKPVFITAPPGYQAGDSMYVLVLPFGSFTPGQPAAAIKLTFTMDNSTELSSAPTGQPLKITASGGFQYGADPLNDPVVDQSLIGASTSSSSTVSLLDVSATTDLHEGETATGPDYPFNYVVTITPAPVTNGDAIQGLDFTFKLPDQVEYTAGTIGITGPGGVTGTATFHPGTGGPGTAGGTVTIHFDSLGTDASGAPIVIKIPVFVPQFDANGVAVLTPDGAPRTIDTTAIYSYTGAWQATTASVDHAAGLQPISGNSSTNTDSTSFVAKALAIQVTDNSMNGNIVPGEPVTYSIAFEVSDYFSLNNLKIADLIGDGVTLLAPGDVGYVTPTLQLTSGGATQTLQFDDLPNNTPAVVNGETVNASGSSVTWDYSRDDSAGGTGATTVNFNVGMLISMIEGGALGSVLVGGEVGNPGATSVGPTQGVISFVAKVLDKYTNANSGASLREKDTISDTVTLAGTSATVVAVDTTAQTITNPNLGTVSDGSTVTDTVAPGSMVLSVIAVNGDTSNTTVIEPGDTVTYGITYTLTTGDYGNLDLTAFLPEPVFNTADPLSNGTNLVSSQDTNSADIVPAAGTYKVIDPLTGETSTPAVVANGTANSISFNFGTRDDPNNTPGQQVQVQFSVVASNKPFADGLALTSQGTSSYTNAAGDTVAASAIKQTPLEEPEVTVKTGVVSTTGDSAGNPSKGTFSPDTSNPNAANPGPPQTGIPPSGTSGPFAVAGTAVGTLFSPSGASDPASALNSDDLNVSGVDGGDLVRVVSTVDNEGHATAWDVNVQGTLPPGYTTADVHNFAVYNSAGQLITGLSGTAEADYFSTGLTVTTGTQGIAAGDKVYVVYDLGLKATQTTGTTLVASSEIVNWASVAGGVAAGNGFVTGTGANEQTLGENAAALSDSATIAVTAPTIAKTVIGSSDADVPLNDVVLGESVQYQITVTVAEGVTSNGSSDIIVTDTLPAGMTLASVDGITFNGVAGSGNASVSIVGGQTVLTFDLGPTLTNSQLDANGTVVIKYTATLAPGATPDPGGTFQNTAVLSYDTNQTARASTTLTELDPSVTEHMTVADSNTGAPIANNGTVFSNEDLTYTVTLTNNGTGIANDVSDLLNLPPGLIYDAGTLAYTGGGTGGSVSGSGPLDIMVGALGVGQTATFTFQAHVATNQPAGTTMTVDTSATATPVTYYSLPGAQQGHQFTANSATQTVQIGQITPTLSISGESNNTDPTNPPAQNNTQATTEATVGEVVTLHGVVQIPEGANPATLTFDLPPGMEYLPGSVTFTLVSPDGDIVSSNNAISGLPQMQDGTPGGANFLSPSGATNTVSSADDVATFRPGNALPPGAITVNGNTVTIDLGTLSNNDGKAQANFVIVQFNAVVENIASNMPGTVLSASMSVNSGAATSNSVAVAVDAPAVTLTKTATAVDNADGTVTYQVTVHNAGSSTAYNVAVDDQAVANESGIAFIGATGSAVGGVDSTTGSDLHYTLGSLAAGGTEVITYTVNVASGMTVQNDTAVATWQSLAGPQTFNGSTTGAAGTDTGPRDFDPGLNPAVNTYRASASTDIGTAQGRVWQDLGNDTTTFSQTGGSNDTPLAGVTVTATITQPDGTVVHETTTTGADGTYNFGVLPDGTVVISLAGNIPAADTLVFDPDGSISNSPPTATFISGGNAQSNVDFSFQAPDTAPVITNWNGSVNYTEGGAPVTLAGSASALDNEIAALGGDFDGATLTVQRYNGATAAPVGTDLFTGTAQLMLSGGNVTFGGSVLGTYTEANGKLSITLGAGATNAAVTEVLDNLAYSSTDTSTVSTGIKIGVTLDDHNTTGAQGTGGVMTSTPVFVTVNEVPQTGIVTATFDDPNNSDPAAAAVVVDPGLAVTSADTFSGATVQIANYRPGEDVLVAGTMPSGVTASFDTATGTMTLSGSNLSAATVQAALRAVEYYDSNDTPDTTTRQVTISVMDSTTGTTTNAAAAAIQIVAHNDSPVLAGNPVSIGTPEDSGTPEGAVGTLVSALTGGGNVTDSDGANAHGGSTPGGLGVAITQADTSEGSWWYSTDGGASWTEFAGSGLPVISATNALHLAADANTRIFFEPNPNWNGTVPNALTFRGWDQFDGAANGSLSALPSGLGSGVDTSGSAYTATAETIGFSVNAVNDAPLASGSATLPATPEDTAAPAGATVGTLFGGNFSDTADQQQSGANPTGSTANTLAGIAITGNGVDPSQGAWQYSTDNGATWNTIAATGLSDSNALVLSSSAELRFVPAANFNGTPGQLTTRLIDSSSVAIAGSVTGADLAAGDTALTGVDVSGAHNGGTTAVSAATVDLGTVVSAVNDAPLASGNATLGTVSPDDPNPPGDTVGGLFGHSFNDGADQQQSGANPTGSTANTLAGIAITGNGAEPSQGTWQYSSDGGKTWTDVPATGLGDNDALVLSATDGLRFKPSGSFSGTPGGLTVRLIETTDTSGSPVADATGVNLGAVGGTTQYSASTVLLSTQVSNSNRPFFSEPQDLIPDFNAPNDYNKLTDSNGLDNSQFPDDNLVTPSEGRGYRTSLSGEPIIPQVWLSGSVGNRFVIEEQHAIIQVPANLFDDTYQGAELSYDARSPGGGPLPQWLLFDARNLTFTGTPPRGTHGTVEVEIVGRDQFGNEATATFQIMVGREPHDLDQMLKRLVVKDAPAPVARTHAPEHGQPVHGRHDVQHQPAHPQPQQHPQQHAQLGRSAFSAQLRDAGPIGRILQARQIVQTIAEVAPVESA
ncbi:DUF4347 domain-containing protein [Paraburkholderia sp. RL18-101-BIB-B]|uniref:DUF4347 domain-containing protein n=1 Tax=Paraburkholderia sp. RL18-101-BIB-B TaxID=3031634 RepID=UPI0038BBE41E